MISSETGLGFPPPHPGEYLREDILPALNMTIADFARHIGVGRAALSDLIHERKGVSTRMAIRLGQALGNGARFWLVLQLQHDLWKEEQRGDVKVQPLVWAEGAA